MSSAARPVMSVPSKPPPPYCSAFLFHAVGKFTSKLMFGAVVSTGAMVPFTWQYSPDVADAATSVALATVAPLLGAPMDVAATLIEPSAEHAAADEIGGVGGVPSLFDDEPPQPASAATARDTPQAARVVFIMLSPYVYSVLLALGKQANQTLADEPIKKTPNRPDDSSPVAEATFLTFVVSEAVSSPEFRPFCSPVNGGKC